MYWADELAARVSGPQVVNDSKTPSGTVHVGSLRGPVMHDAIARALRDRGIPNTLILAAFQGGISLTERPGVPQPVGEKTLFHVEHSPHPGPCSTWNIHHPVRPEN